MTTPVPDLTGEQQRREMLAAGLPHFPWCDEDGAVDDREYPCVCHGERERLADALLPVARKIAADELRAAAMPGDVGCTRDRLLLLDRAAILDPT